MARIFQEHDLFLELQLAMSRALQPSLSGGPLREHQGAGMGEIHSRSEALARSLRRDGLDPREAHLLKALTSGVKAIQGRRLFRI